MREFQILNKQNVNWLFIDQYAGSKQYISYRHFIEQILFAFLKAYRFLRKDSYLDDCKKAFKDFLTAYQEKKNYPMELDVKTIKLSLRLYWFQDSDSYAALVDDTKCCFPLAMDSEGRSSGLFCAIRNIDNKIDIILQTLNQNLDKNWDEALQNEMDKFDDRHPLQKVA